MNIAQIFAELLSSSKKITCESFAFFWRKCFLFHDVDDILGISKYEALLRKNVVYTIKKRSG